MVFGTVEVQVDVELGVRNSRLGEGIGEVTGHTWRHSRPSSLSQVSEYIKTAHLGASSM